MHIQKLCSKISNVIGVIYRIRDKIDTNTAWMIYDALIALSYIIVTLFGGMVIKLTLIHYFCCKRGHGDSASDCRGELIHSCCLKNQIELQFMT